MEMSEKEFDEVVRSVMASHKDVPWIDSLCNNPFTIDMQSMNAILKSETGVSCDEFEFKDKDREKVRAKFFYPMKHGGGSELSFYHKNETAAFIHGLGLVLTKIYGIRIVELDESSESSESSETPKDRDEATTIEKLRNANAELLAIVSSQIRTIEEQSSIINKLSDQVCQFEG